MNMDPMQYNKVGTLNEIFREYKLNCFNVKQYCYNEDISFHKKTMEDKHFIAEDIFNF